MAANVETMFYTRVAPWHGLGVRVETALSSQEALQASGLDWKVIQRPIMTSAYEPVPGYKANIRDTDNKVLGVVSDRYRVVQNAEAFAFTDALLGEGVRYETAGSLQEGRRIWLLAKLPDRYIIEGEQIEPYLVFSSSHDGSGAIKVAMTPVRVENDLIRAGIVESVLSPDDVAKKTINVAKDDFVKCIAVCSQFKLKMPYDFALRILGTYNSQIIQTLMKSTLFVISQDYFGNYEISLRTPLESSMYIAAKEMNVMEEVDCIIKMLKLTRCAS